MHGALTGAYRVPHVAVRNRVVLTNRCPTGLNRGFGGPQLYMALERTMAIAAGRLGLDPAELARRNLIAADEFPYRTPVGRALRLGRLRGLPRRRARARRLRRRGARSSARRAKDGRLYGIGIACCVEPSISNMGYVTLALTAEERAAGLPKSGNAEGATVGDLAARRDHRPDRDDTAGPGARDGRARRSPPTRSASSPRRSRC